MFVIRSADNSKLKTIRKLRQKHWREKLGLFAAEGEDLVEAAERGGWEPEFVLRADREVEPSLLSGVSTLGSGSRAIGVYPQRWSEPGGRLMVWLHGVADPGNVGTVLRAAHALCDGPLVLGPECADPYSPKAVRASMGSIFARPPARAGFDELPGLRIALDARAGEDAARAAEADAFAKSDASQEPLGAANTMANQLGVNATPTILVGKRGGELKAVDADATDVAAYKSAIDGVLGQA